jgi:hypothetical protein
MKEEREEPEDKKNEEENGEDFSREVTYGLMKFWTSEAVEMWNKRQWRNEATAIFLN